MLMEKGQKRKKKEKKQPTRIPIPVFYIYTLVDNAPHANILDTCQASEDLVVVVARHGLHEHAHGPRALEADVRAADAAEGVSGEVVRVALLGQDHASCVLVGGVVGGDEAEEREGEEGREICVVHEDAGAVAVDFKGEDLAVVGVGYDAVGPDGLGDGGAAGGELGGERGVAGLFDEGGGAGEFDAYHGVCGDEEAEDGGVVAGAEGRADEACAAGQGVAYAAEPEGFGARVGLALEAVFVALVGAGGFIEGAFGLFGEYVEKRVEGEQPAIVDEGGRAGVVVELVREGEEVRKRVELVLAFEDEGLLVQGVNSVTVTLEGRL